MASLCYNVSMATRKSITKKTNIKLTSKDASLIMSKEFKDVYGNKHILNYTFVPTPPSSPTIRVKTQKDEDK